MLQIIKKIFMLSGDKKKDLIQGTILQLFLAICEGAIYAVLMWILTTLLNDQFSLQRLLIQSAAFILIMMSQYFLELNVNRLQQTCGYEIMGRIRLQEAEKLRTLPMGLFTGQSIGKLTSIFTNNISFVEMYCMAPITRFMVALFTTIVTTVFMLLINIPMTLVAVMGFIPAFLVYQTAQKKLLESGQNRMQSQNKLVNTVLSYLSGMEVIKAFQLTENKNEELISKLKNYRDISRHYELSALFPLTIYQLLIRIGMGFIYLFGVYFLLSKTITLPIFFFFAIVGMKYYQPIETIFLDYAVVNLIKVGLDQIEELHSSKPLSDCSNLKIIDSSITFRDVEFSYKCDSHVLKGTNFDIRPNTFNALVGPSGSGKTTVLYLIARFWDVNYGEVHIGNTNIKQIPYNQLLEQITMVFQDVYLFSGTIAENISMGNPNATIEEVQAAAKSACCHEFIMKLPQGYDTIINEGGNTLSGGEKQRISIARAILKDSPIVLLDEALSSIDSENAMEIQKAIDSMTRNKTVIMIAHTLSYIQTADNILVMEDGQITQSGTHTQLMNTSTIYQSMWKNEKTAKSWSITI